MKTTQDEYIRRLQEIQDGTSAKLAMLPADEPRFIIDSNKRSISIPEDFTFLGVLRDTGAETIYFEIDRYFDSHDLSENTCIIQFVATDANEKEKFTEGIYPVTKLDVQSVDGKIIFGWTISNEVTAYKSLVSFSIRFYTLGKIASEAGTQSYFTFCLNTLSASLPVLDTLDVTNNVAATYPAFLEEWNSRMQDTYNHANEILLQAESARDAAKKSCDSSKDSFDSARKSADEAQKSQIAAKESEILSGQNLAATTNDKSATLEYSNAAKTAAANAEKSEIAASVSEQSALTAANKTLEAKNATDLNFAEVKTLKDNVENTAQQAIKTTDANALQTIANVADVTRIVGKIAWAENGDMDCGSPLSVDQIILCGGAPNTTDLVEIDCGSPAD